MNAERCTERPLAFQFILQRSAFIVEVMKFVSPEEAVSVIKSGDRVFIHSVAASPQRLVNAMTARAPELRGVEVIHLHTEGDAPYTRPELRDSFRTNCLFIGANVRAAVASGEADYVP